MPRDTCIPILFSLFRQYGYDGATLSKIAAATGLGKASLYHHFPGGKDDMVLSVLDYAEISLQENVLQSLAEKGSPQARLQKMCEHINELYVGGTKPCVLAILQAGTGRDRFHVRVKRVLEIWIKAIADVLLETGLEQSQALERAENAMISIQGALMVSQSLNDVSIFLRTMQRLPQVLLDTE